MFLWYFLELILWSLFVCALNCKHSLIVVVNGLRHSFTLPGLHLFHELASAASSAGRHLVLFVIRMGRLQGATLIFLPRRRVTVSRCGFLTRWVLLELPFAEILRRTLKSFFTFNERWVEGITTLAWPFTQHERSQNLESLCILTHPWLPWSISWVSKTRCKTSHWICITKSPWPGHKTMSISIEEHWNILKWRTWNT